MVDDEVLDNRKSLRSPRFEVKHIAVLEVTHVKLAHRGRRPWSMRDSIDHESACATNPFTAVVIEGDGVFTLLDEFFIQYVQHLQKGHMWVHVGMFVADHAARVIRTLLPPDMKDQFHYL